MKVWLIGENNPYGPDPRYALYCEPPHSAGGRLQRLILGMTERDYLRSFERRNLLSQPKWSAPAARSAAMLLMSEMKSNDCAILFGRRVHDAFFRGESWHPFHWNCREDKPFVRFLALPHPSGLSRAWNEPGAFQRARAAIGELAPHLVPLLGSDRPVGHGGQT